MRRHGLAALALLHCIPALAGPIADEFSDGVFGLPWGASKQQIEAAFPKGKWEAPAKGIEFYEVKDARPIFGLERTKKDTISFGLASDQRLSSVAVTFPKGDYGPLVIKLGEKFGAAETKQPISNANPEAMVVSFRNTWEEPPVTVTLNTAAIAFSTFTSLSIVNTAIRGNVESGM